MNTLIYMCLGLGIFFLIIEGPSLLLRLFYKKDTEKQDKINSIYSNSIKRSSARSSSIGSSSTSGVSNSVGDHSTSGTSNFEQ